MDDVAAEHIEQTTTEQQREQLALERRTHVREWIENREFWRLKSALAEMEIHDLADLMTDLPSEELAVAFRLLGKDRAAEILGFFGAEQQEHLLTTLKSHQVAEIIQEMPPDDRTELLEELPGEFAQKLLNQLRGEEGRIARQLFAYPQESIGRLMTPEYVAVRKDWTVQRVLEHIRRIGEGKETINIIYVVDEHWKLLDELRLKQVLLAEPEETVEDLMDNQGGFLYAYDDEETAIEIFKKYDCVALPVVDSKHTLVGIVTHDDVLDLAEEEDTEDMQMMAGMAALEESYFASGYLRMLRKRMPWLVLLLCAQIFTTIALTGFQALPLFAVLVVFMPLINSPAGNTGTQMAGLMIRGLAVQEIQMRDWFRVLGRELLRGVMFGVFLGVLGYGAALVFAHVMPTASQVDPHLVATAVSAALAAVVIVANVVGSMLPFVFKRIGLDPAVTSGPFIASLMDVSGICIYFTIGLSLLD
ncbi:MAG: magnesium transporter [Phycisphaerae bacterium]|nr:magnesium transporter [Phycisphaerae bacterium]